jgi:hypothetical protein
MIKTTRNDGIASDTVSKRGGTFNYRVCASGSTICSNTATISF